MSAFLDVEVSVPLQGFDEARSLISSIRSHKLVFERERERAHTRKNYKLWSYICELRRLDKDRGATALPISLLRSSG